MGALDIFPPACTAQVRRQADHHQCLVRIGRVTAGLPGLVHQQEGQFGVKHSAHPANVDAPVVQPGRLGILGQRAAVVVDRHVVDIAQRIFELQQSHLVHLAEALREEQRQHLQLEEPGVEVERREHRTAQPPAPHCLGQAAGKHSLRPSCRVAHAASPSCRVIAFSESMK